MGKIQVLDQHTANKIAAGEVVERPASVVKELLENSIDANAKNIIIEVDYGGISLIRIVDDGDGILSDDLRKAFLPHATSKIKSVEDIYSITSLGFRGEALASISSVAKVILKSKPINQGIGREIEIVAGNIVNENDTAVNKGSSIEVKDLFFNIPARKKFLKSSSRESTLITDIVTRIALSRPDLSINLFNNGKKIIHTYGTGILKDTIRSIYGKNISERSIYFENISDEVSIYGFIGMEEIARASRNNQSIFVNGRYIKNKMIVASVENAFKSFATVNKFPFFVLFVEVYPEYIDVNIHPTKADIKFKDDRVIYKRVFDAVHSALKEEVFKSFKLPEEEKNNDDLDEISEDLTFDFNNDNNIEIKTAYTNAELIKEVTKEEIRYNTLKDCNIEVLEGNKKEKKDFKEVYDNNSRMEVREESSTKIAKFNKLKIIGQFNRVYILAESNETLFLIDQHAAHEKILFEKYVKEIESGTIVIQPLLVPIIIELGLDEYSNYEENEAIFTSSGFCIEKFGGNTILIKEVPYFLGKLDAKELFQDISNNIKALGSGKTSEVKYNKIAMMACKAAVKANDILTELEMEELIEKLRFIDDPFHCPHGRPTIIKFTSNEIDKKFKRII